MKIDQQIYYWAHMLDEAFEKDCKARELSWSEVSECIKNGLPSKMKAYDIVECRANGIDCLVAGWKNFPSGWFCVINMYSLDQNGKWIVLDKRELAGGQDEFNQCTDEVIDELSKKFKLWMPEKLDDNGSSLGKVLNDIEWATWQLERSKYEIKRYDFSNDDVNGINFEDIGQNDEGDVMCISWYQRKGLDGAPVQRLLAQKVKNDVDAQKKAMSKSFFAAWQQEPGNSFDSICKQIGKKLDKKVEEVFGIQEVVKTACSIISGLLDDRRLDDLNSKDNYDKYRARADLTNAFSEQFDVSKLIDRRFWWDLIPDQVYRAMVSRAAHPEKSRGVSLKVIRECISKICFDVSQLYVQSNSKYDDMCFASSKTVSLIAGSFGRDPKAVFLANGIGNCLLSGAGSYVDRKTFSYDTDDAEENFMPYSDTSEHETFAAVFAQLKKIRADESDEKFLIAQISKIVDWFHYRGSLAGVFIEGGSKTCQEVSSMKPDEMYESASRKTCRKDLLEKAR